MVQITANTVDIADMIKALDVDSPVNFSYVKRLVAFAADMQLLGGTSGEPNAHGDLLILCQGKVVGIYCSHQDAVIVNGKLIEINHDVRSIRFALRFFRAIDPSLYAVMRTMLREADADLTVEVSKKTANDICLLGLD